MLHPSVFKFYELTSVALCPRPPRKAVLSSIGATSVVAGRVVRVHTVRGTVAAIVVSIASNPEGQANPRVSMIAVEVGLSSEGGGDGEREKIFLNA